MGDRFTLINGDVRTENLTHVELQEQIVDLVMSNLVTIFRWNNDHELELG